MVTSRDVEELNWVRTVAVSLCHKMNNRRWGLRPAPLVEELVRITKEVDVQYRMLALDINVLTLPPAPTSLSPPPHIGTK